MTLWTYAIVDAEVPEVESTGVEGERVRIHRAAGLGVVHGSLEKVPVLDMECLRAHRAVVETVAQRVSAILPCRAGQTISDLAGLEQHLEDRARGLRRSLDRVRDKVQMTLRVFGVADAGGSAETVDDDPSGVERAGPGARYLETKRREAARRHSLPEIERLRRRLGALLHEERVVRADRDRLIGSVYDLISPESVDAYRATVDDYGEEGGRARVVVTGPMPPWAFADWAADVDDAERSA